MHIQAFDVFVRPSVCVQQCDSNRKAFCDNVVFIDVHKNLLTYSVICYNFSKIKAALHVQVYVNESL